ncbi:MAG: hypothetical protein JWN70_6041 [Planctomycetaceae bacterium]|nr:hypothetical protein [Planctomycetaceae bacterium]
MKPWANGSGANVSGTALAGSTDGVPSSPILVDSAIPFRTGILRFGSCLPPFTLAEQTPFAESFFVLAEVSRLIPNFSQHLGQILDRIDEDMEVVGPTTRPNPTPFRQ